MSFKKKNIVDCQNDCFHFCVPVVEQILKSDSLTSFCWLYSFLKVTKWNNILRITRSDDMAYVFVFKILFIQKECDIFSR